MKNKKGEIGWSISNLKGISSSYCTYRMSMEEKFKLMAQP